MFKFLTVAALCAALILPGTDIRAFDVCVDPGAPISASTGQIFLNADLVKDTGAKYARVNFILGPWSSPTDNTRRGPNNLTWKETYDQIINNLVSRGIVVFALIGAEAVKSPHPVNSTGYVNTYTQNFTTIVGQFKDRIRVFESFNEPNDWAGGTTAQVEPAWFAKMLEEIYLSVKINHGRKDDPSWQVTLVSGPLFSHDLDTGAPYMNQVYQAGINQHNWTAIKNEHGTYPFDGIGYHIYVRQGPSTQQQVINGLNANLNAFWNVITNYEGTQTPKRLWISEFGWNTAHVSEAEQARNLTLAFNHFKNDFRITFANWFQISDFGTNDKWGLFRGAPFIDSNKKPSWQAFYDFAIANLPTGSVTGTVTDHLGNPLEGAKVADAEGTYKATTNSAGSYTIQNILPGTYQFEASAFGYRSQTRSVIISGDSQATANFQLLRALPADSPSDAKTRPNTHFLRLNDLVVSAVFSDRVYVQRQDRASGIAVITDVPAQVGNRVNVTGFMYTRDGERLMDFGNLEVFASGSGSPSALLMGTREISGGPFGHQPAVVDDASVVPAIFSTSLNNVGLLVNTRGQVTGTDAGSGIFYVDDGAHLNDGSGNLGVRIIAPGVSLPGIGQFAVVTGVASVTQVNGRLIRLVRVRNAADIAVF